MRKRSRDISENIQDLRTLFYSFVTRNRDPRPRGQLTEDPFMKYTRIHEGACHITRDHELGQSALDRVDGGRGR